MLGQQDGGKRGAAAHTRSRPERARSRARNDECALSPDEAAELEQLRRQIAEVAMERDAAARLIREAIR
ncbi:hypothetical protein MBOT_07080 [Mycobacterium botniense]|uniref:Uncharacterized protein n=1 Tax=Mycobacterium botniense TaxID=84962 RepID=A0A7I9XTJ8_9MYCO|nr:hypothetical protein MBOT_07080 [Mycobacterium botniense]